MSKRLFVGSLPYSITSTQLSDLFSEIGEVDSAKVINDYDSGLSKGFAFVEMRDDKDTDKVIEKFNGYEIEGRKIVVSIARPREDRPRSNNHQYRNNRSKGRNDRNSRRRH